MRQSLKQFIEFVPFTPNCLCDANRNVMIYSALRTATFSPATTTQIWYFILLQLSEFYFVQKYNFFIIGNEKSPVTKPVISQKPLYIRQLDQKYESFQQISTFRHKVWLSTTYTPWFLFNAKMTIFSYIQSLLYFLCNNMFLFKFNGTWHWIESFPLLLKATKYMVPGPMDDCGCSHSLSDLPWTRNEILSTWLIFWW